MSDTDSSAVLAARESRTALSGSLQNMQLDLVLASGSAARAGFLAAAGIAVSLQASDVDEGAIKLAAQSDRQSPAATARRLAIAKARRIAATRPDALVIGADQLLVCGERWFDKPVDTQQARLHLIALRGRTHVLQTAVCVVCNDTLIWSEVAAPTLTMRAFSDAALDGYLAAEGSRLLSSVGAYRLEGPGIHLFESIEGEHSAILGLPMLGLLACLRRQGVLLS